MTLPWLDWHVVLHHAPLIIALGYIVPQISSLRRRHSTTTTPAHLRSWQRVRIALQIVLALAIGALLVAEGVGTSFPLLTAFSALVSLLIASLMAYVELHKGFKPSDSLLAFWLVFTAFQLVILSNDSISRSQTWNFTFELWISVFSITSFFLEWLQPRRVAATHYANPYDEADLFSRLAFHWMAPLMRTGTTKCLTSADLPPLASRDRAHVCSHRLERFWNMELERYYDSQINPGLYYGDVYKVSLGNALLKAFGPRYAASTAFKVVSDLTAFLQPWLLKALLAFVAAYLDGAQPQTSLRPGIYLSLLMFAAAIVQSVCLHQHFERTFSTGMNVRTAVAAEVYKKALKLSSEARSYRTVGDTINLMTVDAQRLQDFCPNGNMLWSGPLQVIICMFSLYKLVGPSMWFGIGVMLVLTPLNAALAVFQKRMQKEQVRHKDTRVRLVTELFAAIKSVKLYSWEDALVARLEHVRNALELAGLKRICAFQALLMNIWTFAPLVTSCVTFATYSIFTNRPLTVDIVFPSLALFQLLGPPMSITPNVITNFIEARLAIGRLTAFLTAEELQPTAVVRVAPSDTDFGVEVSNASFAFSTSDSAVGEYALKNISLCARRGELTCVVGKVGSGKSTLLLAMIGDVHKASGVVKVAGEVAYVPQNAWIFNGTVRENILFGREFDAKWYEETIEACALKDDLAILPQRDQSLVGEKGLSLSGGQKARLSLARAVYARADVYLLDDPLSAVDEHVGQHIISRVLGRQGLIRDRTVILATNNVPVLKHADHIAMMSSGEIVEQGALSDHLPKIKTLLAEFGGKSSALESGSEGWSPYVSGNHPTSGGGGSSSPETVAENDTKLERSAGIRSLQRPPLAMLVPVQPAELLQEHVEQGKVSWSVYKEYARACGYNRLILFVVILGITSGLSLAANVWIKHWAEMNSENQRNVDFAHNLGIYVGISVFVAVLTFAQNILSYVYININAARELHGKMLHSVVRCPMTFFETTPLGRIVNRFSSDMYKVDQQLARTIPTFFGNAFRVLTILAVILYTTPLVLLVLIPLGFVYYRVQQYYLKTSRELKRLDSVSKSPIFAQFQETLDGVSSIRAYGASGRYEYMNECFLDANNRAFFPSISATRWLAVRLEFIGGVILLSASLIAVVSLPFNGISAGVIGLTLTYALQIASALNWLVVLSVDVENNIVSVERILEYTHLPSEAPEIIESNRPSQDWPSNGAVAFKDYSTRYRADLPPVLKHVNLSISNGEKIGVVGRTGAGKSSLTLALFRIIEPTSGRILIDAVDVSSIGLKDLRSRLSIIPQDAQVFEGTVRLNLDPDSKHSDASLWRVLEHSHLKEHVSSMPGQLDARLSEGGTNLSAGQRQLLALARALLTDSHVLVLDEATAAVDVETDKRVQEVIRKEFAARTVITIAHRLNTIVDSDRVVVLSFGEVVECDNPQVLMARESEFQKLCIKGGVL